MKTKFTVCCLFYGDHPGLARRLLESLAKPAFRDHAVFHFGMNNCCQETTDLVIDAAARAGGAYLFTGKQPYLKYPMMRRMFREQPIQTEYVMWFDDDSWVDAAAPSHWFRMVDGAMANADMLGSLYVMNINHKQAMFIEDQPWYTKKPHQRHVVFATGGWWTIRTEILLKHDWPPDLEFHNGGDVMMGALMYQQGYRLRNYREYTHINADDTGKCSTAKRRGTSQPPLGWDYHRPTESTSTTPGWFKHLKQE